MDKSGSAIDADHCTPRERALVKFALKLTKSPQTMSRDDSETLKADGSVSSVGVLLGASGCFRVPSKFFVWPKLPIHSGATAPHRSSLANGVCTPDTWLDRVLN